MKPLFKQVIVINGFSVREEIRSKSRYFKTRIEARKKWQCKWFVCSRTVHEVVINTGPNPTINNSIRAVQFAKLAIETGKKYKSFVPPVAFDLDIDKWVIAFGNPNDAMLFKLVHGGAA